VEPIDNDRWERVRPRLALSDEQVEAMVRRYLPRARLLWQRTIESGLGNTNVKVVLEQGPALVLRVHQRTEAVGRVEKKLTELVAASVPVAEVLYHAEDERGGAPYSLLRYVEGTLLSRVLESGSAAQVEAAGRACGELLARVQRYRFERAGFFDADLGVQPLFPDEGEASPFARYITQTLERAELRAALGARRHAKLSAFVAAHADRFARPDGTLSHGDFKGSNLLLRVEDSAVSVAALLDWEFAFAGHPLFDFSMLLRFDHLLPPGFEPAVIEGYRGSGAELAQDWKASVRLLDLANCVGMLADARSAMRQDLIAIIERTLAAYPC
jgi:aminoglycoside phosphotransferase (APT) family kinase protein